MPYLLCAAFWAFALFHLAAPINLNDRSANDKGEFYIFANLGGLGGLQFNRTVQHIAQMIRAKAHIG